MREKIVRLAKYSNPIDAELVKNYLVVAGITVFSAGTETGGAFAGLDAAFANIELHVPESQLQKAFDVLEAFDEREVAYEETGSEEDASTAIKAGEPEPHQGENEFAPSSAIRSGPPAPELVTGEDDFVVEADDALSEAGEHSIQWSADALATRAWRASFIGMIALPPLLNIYSIWLLVRMSSLNQELSPRAMWKVYGALILDAFVLVLVMLILLVILAR